MSRCHVETHKAIFCLMLSYFVAMLPSTLLLHSYINSASGGCLLPLLACDYGP